MITLSARFRLWRWNQLRNHKKTKPMKTKIFRNPFLSLGAIFALAITAHAQNLYVSAHTPGRGAFPHSILQFTPSGVQSTYASGLLFPRGLAFDSLGNLFAAETLAPADDVEVGKVLKFNLRNKATTLGSAAQFFFEGLAIDIAGNVYVMGTDTSPTAAGTIFKFTPSGDRIVFGSVPGVPDNPTANLGLAFDSTGNLYATASGAQTIYKFAPDGTRTVFVGPDAFAPGEYPAGLAFDSSGNLFVSIETFTDPGADSIVYFSPTGVKSTFATGLTTPRGLAFDSSGNLFVAEVNQPEANQPGDILKFPPGGGPPTVFASFSSGRPQFLTFGPPR
jgi:DNA-binding beta-propeller fold protein YncE